MDEGARSAGNNRRAAGAAVVDDAGSGSKGRAAAPGRVDAELAGGPEAAEVLLEIPVAGTEEAVDEEQGPERGSRSARGLKSRRYAAGEEGDGARRVGDEEEDLVDVPVVVGPSAAAAASAPLDGRLDVSEERSVGDGGRRC